MCELGIFQNWIWFLRSIFRNSTPSDPGFSPRIFAHDTCWSLGLMVVSTRRISVGIIISAFETGKSMMALLGSKSDMALIEKRLSPFLKKTPSNNVLLVNIEGPVWYTIYHHLPVVKGVSSNPSINQPTNGKRTSTIPSPKRNPLDHMTSS